MSLRDHVRIAPRFQRSIKIESDISSANALDGYLCPASATDVLLTVCRHISDTRQAAFTWTGPYGTGKSSLALALCASLSGREKVRTAAAHCLGKTVTNAIDKAFQTREHSWRALPLTGRRAPLAVLLGEALDEAKLAQSRGRWTDERVLATLSGLSASSKGLLIVVDEMGKILEGAAHEGHDIFLLQQIAELAGRSGGKLVFIGILHQSFDEYATRLGRDVRDEWAKVQGRFVDIVVNASGDEQIELVARAIEADHRPPGFAANARAAAAAITAGRASGAAPLATLLTRCWPLHPITTCLLGPLSRRRFGQNQRSLFAFLNSAEPFGLQDFLSSASNTDLYSPDMLWDYLRANLEPAILASADGHRWSIAADAIERCRTAGRTDFPLALLKTIALIDLFKERSGLTASLELLSTCAPSGAKRNDVEQALKLLQDQSLILYRKHLGAYALYAGSDFDIERALDEVMPKADAIDLRKLHAQAGLQPVLAKRHYHETGAMRWFHLDLVPLAELSSMLDAPEQLNHAAGRFLLAIPTANETQPRAAQICLQAAEKAPAHIVIGLSARAWDVVQQARELMALTAISESHPALRGDAVARREVSARLSDCRNLLEQQLERLVDAAHWYVAGEKPVALGSAGINHLASRLADARYPDAPHIPNELLCRLAPSSNAVKAQKDLMRRMLAGQGQSRLGIDGYPAEGGLFDSILLATRIYRADRTGAWRFAPPDGKNDPAHLAPLWQAALAFLEASSGTPVPLARLFDIWRAPPYGIKDGLMPILAVALLLAHRDKLSLYRQGVFQPTIGEVDVETLANDPETVQLRYMKLSSDAERILRELADTADIKTTATVSAADRPFEVARGLIAAYDQLPGFTKRTNRLPPELVELSRVFRHAADPNKLLFDDLPALTLSRAGSTKATAAFVRDGLKALKGAYPKTLQALETALLRELDVASASPSHLEALRERAQHLQQLSGDFRSNAFITRLASYHGQLAEIEGLASLAINKRPFDWVDTDIDEARLKLAQLAQKFILDEAFAHVDNRPDKRMRMAVVVPLHGQPRAMQREFDVTDRDQAEIRELIAKVDTALANADTPRKNIMLAALAELTARYMQDANATPKRKGRGRS